MSEDLSIDDQFDQFLLLCKNGRLEEIQTLNDRFPTNDWPCDWGLHLACQGGHLPMVRFLIEKGAADWTWGVYWAGKGGYLPIIDFLIKKGARDWNWGLYGACTGEQLPTALLMIEKGATEFYPFKHLYKVETAKLCWFYRELTNPKAREALLRTQPRVKGVIIKLLLLEQTKLPKELIRLIFTFL